MVQNLTREESQQLYSWIDEIPLSRPKRNIHRDFSDGVLTAEIVKHYFPKLVEIHNYSAANARPQKVYNWNTLNTKVFKKFGFQVTPEDVEAIVSSEPGVIERVLFSMQAKMSLYRQRLSERQDSRSEVNEPQG